MIRAASLVAAFIVLVGCSVAPPRDASSQRELLEAQDHREALVKARTHWRLRGRIAVSNGGDGGSGRMDWVQDGEHYEIKLSAPVTRRSWRLVGEPGFALLDGLDGGPFHGESAEALLAEHVQWNVPLADLAAWVQGMRAAGAAQIEFQPSGLPEIILQHGWRIEYRAFENSGTLPMPTRVFASRGQQKVRMQVDAWEFPAPTADD